MLSGDQGNASATNLRAPAEQGVRTSLQTNICKSGHQTALQHALKLDRHARALEHPGLRVSCKSYHRSSVPAAPVAPEVKTQS